MYRFAIPPDSPLVDGLDRRTDAFAPDHALIIGGMHALAVVGLWHVSWPAVAAFLVLHTLCLGGGIVIGYHRLLAHHTFRCSRAALRTFATLGALAFQGGPLLWAATHRAHHAHTDEPGDAHASRRGFWWSHVGWTLYKRPNGFRYREQRRLVADLLADPYLAFLDRHAVALNVGAAAACAVLVGRWDVVLWAFPVRIVVDWHLTWLINSYAHFAPVLGPKAPGAGIRNSPVLAAIVFGEGWHANHHRSPGRANFAVERGQVDPAFLAIRALERVGILRVRGGSARPPATAPPADAP